MLKTSGLRQLKKEPRIIRFQENQSEKLCLIAVKLKPVVLRFIKKQTEEVCKAAIMSNSEAIQYMRNQTEDVCLLGLKQTSLVFRYMTERVAEDGSSFELIEMRSTFFYYRKMLVMTPLFLSRLNCPLIEWDG